MEQVISIINKFGYLCGLDEYVIPINCQCNTNLVCTVLSVEIGGHYVVPDYQIILSMLDENAL